MTVMVEHHLGVQRTARYFTLGGEGASISELWIACHGYGQLAAPFLEWFDGIASPSRLIVAPEALSRFYVDPNIAARGPTARVGATWMTREDREHEIADQVTYLDTLLDRVRPPTNGGGVRLRLLGFSQGVATVARWMARGRVRADGLILWAGSFPSDVDLDVFRDRLSGAPVVVVVGKRDQLAPWAAADAQLERFGAAGIDARLVEFGGGHRLDDSTLAELAAAF